MMNITDLAHIADIVAAIGVIGSMIFVGKGSAGRDLEKAEFGQFFVLFRAILIQIENLHYQFQQGLIDKEVYARFQLSWQEALFAFPGTRAMWQLCRHYYSSDFAEYLDEVVASTPIHQQQTTYKKWKELVAANSSKASSGGSKN
jgi:hypothetical protein